MPCPGGLRLSSMQTKSGKSLVLADCRGIMGGKGGGNYTEKHYGQDAQARENSIQHKGKEGKKGGSRPCGNETWKN